MKWFRFYADALRNPKVAALSDREFRLWVSLLSVASENDGIIPPLESLKHVLKARLDHLLTGVERLISIGLIDRLEVAYTPHNWDKFQYKSDTSTPRVTLHRAKVETAPDTEQIQSQIQKKKETRVTRLPSPDFDQWYSRYPNKVGKPEAQRAFAKARTKTSIESLNEGLTRYLAKTDDRPWCNPATWLNQERWTDEPAQVARGSPRPARTDPVRNAIASLLDKMDQSNAEPPAEIEGREPTPRLLSSQQL